MFVTVEHCSVMMCKKSTISITCKDCIIGLSRLSMAKPHFACYTERGKKIPFPMEVSQAELGSFRRTLYMMPDWSSVSRQKMIGMNLKEKLNRTLLEHIGMSNMI